MTKFNFEGYKITEWIKSNKEFLKLVIPAIVSLAIANSWIDVGFGTILGKFILDGIDYFISK